MFLGAAVSKKGAVVSNKPQSCRKLWFISSFYPSSSGCLCLTLGPTLSATFLQEFVIFSSIIRLWCIFFGARRFDKSHTRASATRLSFQRPPDSSVNSFFSPKFPHFTVVTVWSSGSLLLNWRSFTESSPDSTYSLWASDLVAQVELMISSSVLRVVLF